MKFYDENSEYDARKKGRDEEDQRKYKISLEEKENMNVLQTCDDEMRKREGNHGDVEPRTNIDCLAGK